MLFLCTFVTAIYRMFVTPEDKRNKISKFIINVICFMQTDVLNTTRVFFLANTIRIHF